MACRRDYREHGAVRICEVSDAFSGHLHFSNGERTGSIVRAASTSARKRTREKFRGDIFPRGFHLRRHPGMAIRDRKSGQIDRDGKETERGQNTIRGGSDPIAPHNRGPIPSGFGGHSRLLLLEYAARVLAAQEKGNWRICKTARQTKA